MQTKKKSIIESLVNTISGLIIGLSIQLLMYPILEIEVTIQQNLLLTSVFFIVSVIRGYIIRRIFNN
jgi:hypothetical protein